MTLIWDAIQPLNDIIYSIIFSQNKRPIEKVCKQTNRLGLSVLGDPFMCRNKKTHRNVFNFLPAD